MEGILNTSHMLSRFILKDGLSQVQTLWGVSPGPASSGYCRGVLGSVAVLLGIGFVPKCELKKSDADFSRVDGCCSRFYT